MTRLRDTDVAPRSTPPDRTITALGLLQSVIRSGEPWTETCYAAVTEALAEHNRYRDALERIAEGAECSIGLGAASKHGSFCAYHVAQEALNG